MFWNFLKNIVDFGFTRHVAIHLVGIGKERPGCSPCTSLFEIELGKNGTSWRKASRHGISKQISELRLPYIAQCQIGFVPLKWTAGSIFHIEYLIGQHDGSIPSIVCAYKLVEVDIVLHVGIASTGEIAGVSVPSENVDRFRKNCDMNGWWRKLAPTGGYGTPQWWMG